MESEDCRNVKVSLADSATPVAVACCAFKVPGVPSSLNLADAYERFDEQPFKDNVRWRHLVVRHALFHPTTNGSGNRNRSEESGSRHSCAQPRQNLNLPNGLRWSRDQEDQARPPSSSRVCQSQERKLSRLLMSPFVSFLDKKCGNYGSQSNCRLFV